MALRNQAGEPVGIGDRDMWGPSQSRFPTRLGKIRYAFRELPLAESEDDIDALLPQAVKGGGS